MFFANLTKSLNQSSIIITFLLISIPSLQMTIIKKGAVLNIDYLRQPPLLTYSTL